jgi:hypothetical protein
LQLHDYLKNKKKKQKKNNKKIRYPFDVWASSPFVACSDCVFLMSGTMTITARSSPWMDVMSQHMMTLILGRWPWLGKGASPETT